MLDLDTIFFAEGMRQHYTVSFDQLLRTGRSSGNTEISILKNGILSAQIDMNLEQVVPVIDERLTRASIIAGYYPQGFRIYLM